MPHHRKIILTTIVTGGQTGVDISAVKAAIEYGVPYSGWVPKGYKNESGTIDPYLRNGFFESDDESFRSRTERNVIISDATLVLYDRYKDEGTLLTVKFAHNHRKKCLVVDISAKSVIESVLLISKWLICNRIKKLNIAGPRESNSSGIEQKTREIFRLLFSALQQPNKKIVGEVANLAQERFFSNFRHWDIIRWLIPAWFIALFTGAEICLITLCSSEAINRGCKIGILVAIAFFVIFLAIIFQILLRRLKTYHIKEWDDFHDTIKNLPLSKTEKAILIRELPFSFDNKGHTKTATRYFGWIIWLCVIILVIQFGATIFTCIS